MAELHGLRLDDLIRVCCEYGVSDIKVGDVSICFNRWPTVTNKQAVQSSAEGGRPEVSEISNASLDDLYVRDPAAYEEALLLVTDKE